MDSESFSRNNNFNRVASEEPGGMSPAPEENASENRTITETELGESISRSMSGNVDGIEETANAAIDNRTDVSMPVNTSGAVLLNTSTNATSPSRQTSPLVTSTTQSFDASADRSNGTDQNASTGRINSTGRSKPHKGLIIGLAAVFVAAVAAIVVLLTVNFGGQPDTTGNTDEDTGEAAETTPVVSIDDIAAGMVTAKFDNNKTVVYNAAYVINGVAVTIDSGTFTTATDEQNVFLVINGGKLIINGPVEISKSGSANFNGRGDDYSFYGTNSAIAVVGTGSSAVINGATILTDTPGANAVVATNSGEVTIADSTISTTRDNSRGLHATYKGAIKASGVSINTLGGSSAALATDRGEGTVSAADMYLQTAGAGSPLIYSTGEISVLDSKGVAYGAQIAVVEGKNSVLLTDCEFSAYGIGNRNGVDNAAVMIYQSMSGDASTGTGSFTATDCTLTVSPESTVYSTVPFFFVTNTDAAISLTDVTANFSPNASFVSAIGTSEWGKSGANGGVVKIAATDLAATNTNMDVDSISSVAGL